MMQFTDIEDLTRQMITAIGIQIIHYGDLEPKTRNACLNVSDYGFYYFGKKRLYLNEEQPAEERTKTMLHELGHIVLRCLDDPKGEAEADRFMNDFFFILSKLEECQREKMTA